MYLFEYVCANVLPFLRPLSPRLELGLKGQFQCLNFTIGGHTFRLHRSLLSPWSSIASYNKLASLSLSLFASYAVLMRPEKTLNICSWAASNQAHYFVMVNLAVKPATNVAIMPY